MIYIHIPFCHRKCTYCAFFSKPVTHSSVSPKRAATSPGSGEENLTCPPVISSPKLGEVPEGRRSVSMQEWSPAYNEGQHYFTIPMQWHLTLTHAIEGWTRDTVMQELCDLRETQFKDFSGTIVYTARFHLDSITDDTLQDVTYTPESLEDIDLGQVYDICELTINGTPTAVE